MKKSTGILTDIYLHNNELKHLLYKNDNKKYNRLIFT